MRTISDDRDAPKPVTGTANSKAALKAMLKAAVMNTGGVPLNGVVIGPPEPKDAPRPPKVQAMPIESESGNIPGNISRDPMSISTPSEAVQKFDMPTADEVARAIVAAARETDEDPIACAMGNGQMRCRHYAMHAIAHAFPLMTSRTLATVVGFPGGSPEKFYGNSLTMVVRPPRHGKGHMAKWWNDGAYDRVIRAIRGTAPALSALPVQRDPAPEETLMSTDPNKPQDPNQNPKPADPNRPGR